MTCSFELFELARALRERIHQDLQMTEVIDALTANRVTHVEHLAHLDVHDLQLPPHVGANLTQLMAALIQAARQRKRVDRHRRYMLACPSCIAIACM